MIKCMTFACMMILFCVSVLWWSSWHDGIGSKIDRSWIWANCLFGWGVLYLRLLGEQHKNDDNE